MDSFEEDSDYFEEDNDHFGFNENAVPTEAKDENCKALYEGDLFSSIKPHSEYISVEQERKYGHQGPTAYSYACCCYSSPFSVGHETTGCKKPTNDPAAYPLNGSHKASIADSSPRHMPPGRPCSLIAQHIDPNPCQDEVPVNLMSDMFQFPDFRETYAQSAEWEKKNTLQRKQENNPKRSRLQFQQPEKSSGNMNSSGFMEPQKIRRHSGNSDRHRKVVTSRGPRDRRMRLSIETAIKFFEIQDRLGFDQPSKAVEWLIQNSRSAIDQLPAISQSALDISSHLKSNSDSLSPFLHRDTDISGADFVTGFEENMGIADFLSPSLFTEPSILKEQSRSKRKKYNSRKNSVKSALVNSTGRRRHIAVLKDNRSKARERARERTKEKSCARVKATSPSPHMNHTRAPEIKALSFQENTASASSGNTLNDRMEASISQLYCVAPTFKIGVQEKSLNRRFHHHGCSLTAQDSVKELAENSHLSGHSNLSFNYSQSQIQSSVQTVAQRYKHQPEDRSMESTGSFTGLCSTTFPPAVPAMDVDLQSRISDLYVDYSLLQ